MADSAARDRHQRAEGAVAPHRPWRLLARTWLSLSFALSYPDKQLAEKVRSGAMQAELDALARIWGLDLPLTASHEPISCEARPEDALRRLRREATRLFVGSPTPAVDPYESTWAAKRKGLDPLRFIGPASIEVERFARTCGLVRPAGTNEPLDHVSTELELLGYLASCQAKTGRQSPRGAPCAFPGGSAGNAHEQFLARHIDTWIPEFALTLAREANESFYASTAQTLHGVVASLKGE